MMHDIAVVYASCATAVADCEDTSGSPDLNWLVLPGAILVVVVLALVVYFAMKGRRGG